MQRPLKALIEKSVKEEQIKHTTLIETVTGLEIIKSVRAQNRMRTIWDQSVNKTVYYADKGHFFISKYYIFHSIYLTIFKYSNCCRGSIFSK